MPREFRRRGKKTKKTADKDEWKEVAHFHDDYQEEQHAGPSWIIPAPKGPEEINLEAPFGYLDVNVKAYFRTVDVQIRNWQDVRADAGEGNDDLDPNEERRLFFIAALTEMSGKEKQLATDPDCSNILERMAHSMDDFARRVFVDRLAGSYEVLIKHRFASHVCQTFFTIAADTIGREEKGILPPTADSSEGELRTLTKLIVAICEELKPSFTSFIMDAFASHVIRALLLLLSPSLSSSDERTSKSHSTVRSKKSTAWKARQAPMTNVFVKSKGNAPDNPLGRSIPKQFRKVAADFVRILREDLSENEVRALAVDKVASPVLQMMLEVEADQGTSDVPDSLMDRVLVGIITSYNKNPSATPEQSDYLFTLFRDPTSSHLLETLVTRAPARAFATLWSTYFQGKLARLSNHPVANFVVARAMERVNPGQLELACEELKDAWGKIIKSSRTGVLRVMIDRAAILRSREKEIGEAMCAALELITADDCNLFVPCVMILKPLPQYRSSVALAQSRTHDVEIHEARGEKGIQETSNDPLEPKVQGAILVQSLLRLNEPHNLLVIDSIKSLPVEDLLRLARHPTSSRVFDVLLESPTVPFKMKRDFVMSFIGHYHVLVDDRIGSRVGDRCWAFADPYLREKIARSLFVHEQFLAGSFYGKFFARNLNLYLLQRKPEEWKNLQSQRKLSSLQPIKSNPHEPPTDMSATLTPLTDKPNKRKRDPRPENEIDALFNASFGKRIKKGVLEPEQASSVQSSTSDHTVISHLVTDKELKDVFGAIRAAPKDQKDTKKNRAR